MHYHKKKHFSIVSIDPVILTPWQSGWQKVGFVDDSS